MNKEEAIQGLEKLEKEGGMLEPKLHDSIKFAVKELKKEKEVKDTLSDFAISDPANVTAIVKINEEAPRFILNQTDRSATYEETEIKVLQELEGERIFIYKGDKVWSIISTELYNQAVKTMKAWFGVTKIKIEFLVADEKNYPVIVYHDTLGVLIAPRVEAENE